MAEDGACSPRNQRFPFEQRNYFIEAVTNTRAALPDKRPNGLLLQKHIQI